jgi:ABC-type transport system substrate-binding protein
MSGTAEVDRLIARGRSETSSAVRHAVYRQIEDIITRDTLLLPLFHEQAYRFARPEIEGMSRSYESFSLDYANLSIR